jgi:integrase
VFYEAPEWRLSPKFYWDLLDARADDLDAGDALYCSEEGAPYTSSDTICKAMTSLLQNEMHVKDWTCYSFRKSSISHLFRSGLNERQVNAFTGHSNNAHTALSYYYKLNKRTVGAALRVPPSATVPIPEEAAAFLAADDLDA